MKLFKRIFRLLGLHKVIALLGIMWVGSMTFFLDRILTRGIIKELDKFIATGDLSSISDTLIQYNHYIKGSAVIAWVKALNKANNRNELVNVAQDYLNMHDKDEKGALYLLMAIILTRPEFDGHGETFGEIMTKVRGMENGTAALKYLEDKGLVHRLDSLKEFRAKPLEYILDEKKSKFTVFVKDKVDKVATGYINA